MKLEKGILSNNTKFIEKQFQKMGIEIDNEARDLYRNDFMVGEIKKNILSDFEQ